MRRFAFLNASHRMEGMRYLGIDYGMRRIGVATADEETKIAVPRGIIVRTGDRQALREIAALAALERIGMIVIGLPLGHDGADTAASRTVRAFAAALKENTGVPVIVENELFTSRMATHSGVKQGQIDAASAAIILQSFLDKPEVSVSDALRQTHTSLSWVIPTYNEEGRIERTIRDVDAYLKARQSSGGYEILVCDSASRDRTAAIVHALCRDMPHLKMMRVENRGKGWAVREAMLAARGDIRIFSDADNSVSPEQFGALFPLLRASGSDGGGYDVVIGSIEVPGAFIEEQAQWYRRILGKLAKYVIRAGTGLWDIHDSQRGFKLFTRAAAERVFPHQTITGWGFDFEILLIARHAGLTIKEVPVHWVNPGGSKVGLAAYISTFRDLVQVMKNAALGRYPTGA